MSALAGARSLPMWQALRTRDFRLLWGSEAISLIGDQFHIVALSWLVIDLTRSGLALGTVLIASGIPRALLMLPFGVLADRRPPRTLMLIAHLARGVVVGAMAALVLAGSPSLPLLALLGAAVGAIDALYLPAQQAFLPRTLEPERLPSANALLQGTLQLTSIVGPPLAGAFIAIVGTGTAFVIDTASFFLAAVVIMMISSRGLPARPGTGEAGTAGTTAAESAERSSFGRAIREALAYIRADGALATTLVLSMVLNFALNGPALVGMPWLAEIRYNAGPAGLGLLTAGWAAGALAGTLIAGNVRAERPGRILLVAVGGCGIAMLGVGLAPVLPLAMACLAVMGLGIGYCNIVAISWLQSRVPTEMVGRVMSVTMLMGFAATPLSLAFAGALLDVNATALFLAAGTIVAGVAVVAGLRRYAEAFDTPREVPADPGVAQAA
jgi:MFS family permease